MKYGYFDEQNNEYVIDRVDTLASWTNYIGLKNMVAVINQTGGGYAFYKSPQYHRVTRFRANAIPMDRPGFDIYIKDKEDQDYWSITWQPVGKDLHEANYICRHGLSYTVYECEYKGIQASQTMSVPLKDDAIIMDVVIKNTTNTTRTLELTSFVEFSFHHIPIDHENFQMSLYCASSSYEEGTILYDLVYEEFGYQYFTCSEESDAFDCLRDTFIGPYRSERNPIGVECGCKNSFEKGGNHCGSLQKEIVLQPKESKRILYFLGEGGLKEAFKIKEKYKDKTVLDDAYKELKQFWKKRQDVFKVQTSDSNMNVMLNTWTLYQATINVLFSRFASFIEVGGRTGLGYRDTAQDAMCVLASETDACKKRILQLLKALSHHGYGVHLFEPRWFEPSKDEKKPFKSPTVIPTVNEQDKVHGLKDACSDDALWLIPTIDEYIKETNDIAFLNEEIRYAEGDMGTVFEHMKKIVDFSMTHVGKHGVCLGLRADWNDCLNLGGGESTLVTFLLYEALMHMIPLAKIMKDPIYQTYEMEVKKLETLCEKELFDGKWFIRGYTKNGEKIGTNHDEEGKIHLESNAWAVLSGCSNHEMSQATLDSIDEWLYTPYGLLLNAPSYTKPNDAIGFIGRVIPGLKENGSIFSHPNPWVWAAECKMGNGDRAMRYYKALTPSYQNDMIEIRKSEPYSYCQFISGKDHSAYGCAHHPFMTGSGGWAYYASTHYMLGIRPSYNELIVDPCIPSTWDGFKVERIWRDTVYKIEVKNPEHVCKNVVKIVVDGKRVSHILPKGNHEVCHVEVILGKECYHD